MYTNQRNISRVLAAAVASAGFAIAPMPTFATSLTCTSATFTATADNSGNIVVSCTSPGGGTPACSLTASPSTLPAAGGSVTLTASNCGTVSSVAKNGSQIASSGASWSDSIPANSGTSSVSFTYTVQSSNGNDSVVVTESGSGGTTSPPPGGPIACNGYASTLVYDLPWAAQSSAITKGFGGSQIVVARFTTPNVGPTSSATLSSIEFGDAKTFRAGSLSTSPCDLSGTGVGNASVWNGNSQGPSVSYQIGGSINRLMSGGRVVLQPNTTYYLNLVNRNADGSSSCKSGTCNMIIQLTKPTGT